MSFAGSAVNSFHGLMKILFSSVIISVFLKSRSGLIRSQTQFHMGTKIVTQMYDIDYAGLSI